MERREEPVCLHPTMTPEGELTFHYGSPGVRYFLEGEPVHAGDILEMQSEEGGWIQVRYEYTWERTTRRLQAFVHCGNDACLPLPLTARFRWAART